MRQYNVNNSRPENEVLVGTGSYQYKSRGR